MVVLQSLHCTLLVVVCSARSLDVSRLYCWTDQRDSDDNRGCCGWDAPSCWI